MPAAPLDTLEQSINTARVRLLDAIQGLAGEILTDGAPFTIVYINNAWRRLQELLVNYGITWLKIETVLPGITATTQADPAVQVFINWSNYFDGTSLLGAPILPDDFITPLLLWERVTGSTGSFYNMDRMDNGLPAVPKANTNRSWEWRNGAIYLPGALQRTDIRLRYAAFFPDFVTAVTTPFANQPIPILRAYNPLAWFICSEVAKARGDMDAAEFDKQGMASAKMMFDLDSMEATSLDQITPNQGAAGPKGVANANAAV